MTNIKIAAQVGLGVVVFFIMIFMMQSRLRWASVHVHFVIPCGFRGLFVLQARSDGPHGHQLVGTRYEYQIPLHGTLQIRSDDPIFRWHHLSAEFSNAVPLSVDSTIAAEQVQLFSLDTDQKGNSYYLLGVEEEKKQYYLSHQRELGTVTNDDSQ